MQLEIKGFIEFCRFLANYPKAIEKSKELQSLLEFCYQSLNNCNCKGKEAEFNQITEQEFSKRLEKLSPETAGILSLELKENIYSSVTVSSLYNISIKIK